ncbi:MAG: hypothetical protein LBI73_04830 [Myroides sp.]|jgi:hypothetical protein|uniref:Lipoprotein n=1 Tax=Myroides marinus TaxID=703342 RepID=A0A161U4Q2_9FLAO|nr:hypothetical protein [Myroides marinus]KZE80276.1 hypothetical protein AV926_10455 [Myroides marinus]MDR0194426.1 hypothetical protein [Myroides sp.]SEI67984.1 hypothetical protein SAMN04488018_10322 [Myroides marinus]
MKKFFTLTGISFMFLLTSCDDGNLVYKDIDFSKVTAVERCTTLGADKIYFKLQNDEALILVIDAENIMKDETNSIKEVNIDGTATSLDYRKYSAKVAANSICNLPPPASPSVIQSIPASPGGTVVIEDNLQITNATSTTSNAVNLIYQYIFSLKNINFSEGQTNIKYDKMLFGTTNYITRALDFNFNNNNTQGLNDFSCNNLLYTLRDKEALSLNLTEADLPTAPTTTDKVIELSKDRLVQLKQYQRGGIKLTDVCNNDGDIPGSSPSNPNRLLEHWGALQGQIVIRTRETKPVDGSKPKLLHEIKLINVTFVKANYTNKSFTKGLIDFGTYVTDIK